MFWFKPEKYWKPYKNYSSYERDYNFNILSNRLFNSEQVYSLYETDEWTFVYRSDEPEYGTDEYKTLREKLHKNKMYIVYIGNYILSVKKEIFDKIKNQENKLISIE